MPWQTQERSYLISTCRGCGFEARFRALLGLVAVGPSLKAKRMETFATIMKGKELIEEFRDFVVPEGLKFTFADKAIVQDLPMY